MPEIRINKFIRECGIASRREADIILQEGRVTVNGQVAVPGMIISDEDVVCVDGKEIRILREKHVVAYYKPLGVTCTKRDEHAKATLEDVFHYPVNLTYAGRLDQDSEGLLIMTDDGELIDRMMRGRYGHEKEYIVTLKKEVTDEFLKKFAEGIYLPDLEMVTKPCKVERIGNKKIRVILTQGLNRQIRRMCRVLKNDVVNLKRIRVVNIKLGKLKPGEYRDLTKEELEELYSRLHLEREA